MNLTGQVPASDYRFLLTLQTNTMSGNLQIVQDGLGGSSALQISNAAALVQGNLTVAGTISSGTAVTPLPLKLMTLAANPGAGAVEGMMYYNTTDRVVMIYATDGIGGAPGWRKVQSAP